MIIRLRQFLPDAFFVVCFPKLGVALNDCTAGEVFSYLATVQRSDDGVTPLWTPLGAAAACEAMGIGRARLERARRTLRLAGLLEERKMARCWGKAIEYRINFGRLQEMFPGRRRPATHAQHSEHDSRSAGEHDSRIETAHEIPPNSRSHAERESPSEINHEIPNSPLKINHEISALNKDRASERVQKREKKERELLAALAEEKRESTSLTAVVVEQAQPSLIEISPEEEPDQGAETALALVDPPALLPETGPLVKQITLKDQVREAFDFWAAHFRKRNPRLTPERERKIGARLREGYTLEQIKHAIIGCSESAFHMGANERETVYDDIELICRNGVKLESFNQQWENNHGEQRQEPAKQLSKNSKRLIDSLTALSESDDRSDGTGDTRYPGLTLLR